MAPAAQRSRQTTARAAKSTATSPKGGAARGRASGSTAPRTTGKTGTKRTARTAKPARSAKSAKTAKPATSAKAAKTAKTQGKASGSGTHDHDLTLTIPVDSAASAVGKVVSLPVVAAQRILPSAGGLPLYVGLGALGVVGVLEWPVAAGIGVGYAVLRQGGPLNPHPGGNGAE
ncbi:hypothetical protein [Actinacidiphila rubida]|uniref:Uncharacterized protein n=1 Tax=Actinacidiphila rubida TaxID=310780 RepID=A0A1H8EKR9_9ACTN|nr:hypothetical protein [Actinacidiphila rubida]SEN19704.1 hypothetical protein SAMN05216267_1002246 [Actinacidiphila rubida]